MAYRLRTGEDPVPRQIQQILFEEVDAALESLQGGSEADRDRRIHETRKSIKKSRALVRLMAPHLKKREFRKANRTFRDVGRGLSELRDAQAMIESFAALPEDMLIPALREKFQEQLTSAKNAMLASMNVGETIGRAIEQLIKIRLQPMIFEVNETGFSALEKGLIEFYRQGRRAMRRAQEDASAEKLHDFRKRVKDHWYHMRLVSSSEVPAIQERLEKLRELEGLLGDGNNLHVLRAKLGESRTEMTLTAALRAQEEELGTKALSLGKSVYAFKPKHFARQLAPLHEIWGASLGVRRKQAQIEMSGTKRRSVNQVAS